MVEIADSLDHSVLYIDDNDVPYEEDIIRHPYSVRYWCRYLENKRNAHTSNKIYLYERAVQELPGSYKLWKEYLDYRIRLTDVLGLERNWDSLNELYERALLNLYSMPRIWLDYTKLLMRQKKISATRRTFDRALRVLPLSQHEKIWKEYFKFVDKFVSNTETKFIIYARYIKFEPDYTEDYIAFLLDHDRVEDGVCLLYGLLSKFGGYKSPKGTKEHDLWRKLIQEMTNAPFSYSKVVFSKSLDATNPSSLAHITNTVERIVKLVKNKFSEELGWIWTTLANYYTRCKDFTKAAQIYEEGILDVKKVRDFSQIFDAYAKFQESIIGIKLSLVEKKKKISNKKNKKIEEPSQDVKASIEELNKDIDARLIEFEELIKRRPFLLSDVILRSEPHNVSEWEKRVMLCKGNPDKTIDTFETAISTIQPKKATVKLLSSLWLDYAHYYADELRNPEQAKNIYDRAVQVPFNSVNELVDVWIDYAEFEKRKEGLTKALELLARATKPLKSVKVNYHDDHETAQVRLFKSTKLWTFIIELEKELNSAPRIRAAYDRVLDLRIANSQIIFQYAEYLEKCQYFEDAYKIYERGIELFGYPIAFDIWNVYLAKFVERYQGTKLERARDLFNQAILDVPPQFAKPLYIAYGQLEEKYGLARNAMKIYDRATKAVASTDKLEMYQFYVEKAMNAFGVTAARQIFEDAIENLPDVQVKDLSLQYAELEMKLGEVERARAIYAYGSQFADPRTIPIYWNTWQDFEVKFGNEESFREMLRVKRSVQAQYSTRDLSFVSAGLVKPSMAAPSTEEIKLD